MAERESVWARRFLGAAIVQGGLAFALLVVFLYLMVFGEQSQSPSRIVAGGSVGTWVLVGFTGHVLIGVLAIGLSALFYHYIEAVWGRPYSGLNNALAWGHLILANVGVLGASWLMILSGYVGGSHLLSATTAPPAVFGEVHELIEGYILPIMAFIIVGALGGLLGGIGYVRAWFGKGTASTTA